MNPKGGLLLVLARGSRRQLKTLNRRCCGQNQYASVPTARSNGPWCVGLIISPAEGMLILSPDPARSADAGDGQIVPKILRTVRRRTH